MPVVELEYARLSRLTGMRGKNKILEALPYLGLDIEGGDARTVRVEYSPNRPDYSTEYGIAAGLRYMAGGAKPAAKSLPRAQRSGEVIRVEKSVSKIRPSIVGLVARGAGLEGRAIRVLMSMQEDLHSGIGRKRSKSSIGMHRLDGVSFPLSYGTVPRSHRFVPLGSDSEMSIDEIVNKTEAGIEYGKIAGPGRVPILRDSQGGTVSFPPVINAASTALVPGTDGVFVEVTGIGKKETEDALSVAAMTLSEMGFSLYQVGVSGAGCTTARLEPRKQKLAAGLVSETLGVKANAAQTRSWLAKSGIASSRQSGGVLECLIPRHRFDIFGPMDLVEEAMLGYGVQNMAPSLPPHDFIGSASSLSNTVRVLGETMIGLGCTEVKNSALVEASNDGGLSVSEGTVLRTSLLAGLLGTLSHNVHEEYPQRLFEIGTVFGAGLPVTEEIRICAVLAHGGANYTEAKSLLQALLGALGEKARTGAAQNPLMKNGRSAAVRVGNEDVGAVGLVDDAVRSEYKIREKVCAFEIAVSGLIFD